ncbi:MAG: sulfatase-like hydrolase/transferase [Bacteroidota bacterium]
MKVTISKFYITISASIVLAVINITTCHSHNVKQKKANLLFIMTDEQQANTMEIYGNRNIQTPNLNRLSEQSFVFKNTYVTQPVCSPSRSSIMSGLYPHTTGVTRNNIPLSKDTPCFPELLNDHDYKTAYIGKWHLGDEVFAQHGFETWISMEDGYSGYYTEGKDRDTRSDYHLWLIEKGYNPDDEKNNKFSRYFSPSLPSIEHCKPKFLEEKACEYLEEVKNDPFVLYVNFLEPHMPFTGPLNDLHQDDDVYLPGNFDDLLDDYDPLRYRLIRQSSLDRYANNEDSFKRLIGKYWGLVTQVDISVGAILDKLHELGLDKNTIVVFTSDHGDMMGAHQMVGKRVMFEESVRVPLMMRIPFITTQQKIINQRVSQIDIVPTLLELMGKPIPESMEGKSIAPHLIEGCNLPEDFIFIEWSPDFEVESRIYKRSSIPVSEEKYRRAMMSNVRTVISPDGWKLCLRDSDCNSLFNLNNDPLETKNLFNDTTVREKITLLTKKIEDWQKQTGDTLKLNFLSQLIK